MLDHKSAWSRNLNFQLGKQVDTVIDDRPRYVFQAEFPSISYNQRLDLQLYEKASESMLKELEAH